MAAITHYDVIIVGSGQSGTPLASALANAGRKTALVERQHLGGTCVNVGCTPTKTIIASGRVAHLARRAADYGVHIDDISIDMTKIRQRKRDIVASFSAGSERRLRQAGVDVILGQAEFSKPKTLRIHLNQGGEQFISGDLIILNVGERPITPSLPGLEDVDAARVLDSTSIMELDEIPSHLLVLGGGPIGLEFAQLSRRLGSNVSIIQRASQLVPREDEDIAQCIREVLEQDGINVYLAANARSIAMGESVDTPITLTLQNAAGDSIDLHGSHILMAVGRKPNTDSLNLQAAGVSTDSRGYLIVDEKLATTADGVYGLGDAHGGPAFTHMSYDDFRILRANLLPQAGTPISSRMKTTHESFSRQLVPSVTYTDPQLAHVGKHEKELISAGQRYRKAVMPMAHVARALEADETRGMMKAMVDPDSGEILGFTCLGLEGGELMAVVQTAMMGRLRWEDLEAAVWAHPSLAESLNNLWGTLTD